MSYSVKQNYNGKYDLYEKESETIIELSKNETDIRSICRKLNLGAGFNGWTPLFVAKKMN